MTRIMEDCHATDPHGESGQVSLGEAVGARNAAAARWVGSRNTTDRNAAIDAHNLAAAIESGEAGKDGKDGKG